MRFIISIVFVLFSISAFGQIDRCSTDEYRESLKEKGLYNYSKKSIPKQSLSHGNHIIPVVVHVLYNNNEQNSR